MSKSDVQMGTVVENAPVIETGADNTQITIEPTTTETTSERPLSRREQAMADIYRRREESRTVELQYGENMGTEARERALAERLMSGEPEPGGNDGQQGVQQQVSTEPGTQEVQQLEANQQATSQVQQPVQTQAQAHAQQPEKVRVNINGTILELDPEEVSNLVAEGARARLAAQQGAQHQPQQTQTAPVAQPQTQPDYNALFTEEDAQRTYERITSGSEEDGALAIRDLATNIARQVASQQPRVDPQQIARQVEDRIRAETQQRADLQTIGSEFPEIFNSDVLARTAGAEAHLVAQQYARMGVQKSRLEVYREACGRVRSALPVQNPAPVSETQQASVQPVQPVVSVRQVDKGAIQRVPVGAGGRREAGQTVQPPSRSDVVERMRKARGQASMR